MFSKYSRFFAKKIVFSREFQNFDQKKKKKKNVDNILFSVMSLYLIHHFDMLF